MSERGSWQAARAEFPALERRAYLNHAAMSPLPLRVRGALDGFLDRWEREDLNEELDLSFGDGLRAALGRLLSCAPEELAFVPSTSSGLSRALRSLPLEAGQAVAVPTTEFPAAVYPLRELERFGVSRLAVAPGGDRPWVDEDDSLAAAERKEVAAVCTSLVSYTSGHRHDLARLAAGCHERGAFLVVDAMQAAGAVRIDLSGAETPDVLSFGPVKWIPGPHGVAVVRVAPAARERMRPVTGWCGVVRDGWKELADHELPELPTARVLEVGSPAFLSQVGWLASLEWLEESGDARREERILDLGERLIAGLEAEPGWRLASPRERERRGGIVRLEHPDAAAWQARLKRAGFSVSLRVGALRVAPHYWNAEDEIDRLLEALSG